MTRVSMLLMLAGAWVALPGCSGEEGPAGESTVSLVAVPRQNPKYRVTVTESGDRALSVQKIVTVEVLDFP